MLATGLRLSSAIALDTDDVDLERAEIEVRSTKGNRPDRVLLGPKSSESGATKIIALVFVDSTVRRRAAA